MEIVTEPEIRTAEQARRYAEELQQLLRAIGATDADMESGQMRVEANVSLRPRGAEAFGTRVEVKNMNSFRSVERAIAFEIERQAAALDAGDPLTMETRGWDDGRGSRPTGCGRRKTSRRLPLLPRARPAAAPSTRPGSTRSGRAAGAAGRAPRALSDASSAVGLRRGRDRRRARARTSMRRSRDRRAPTPKRVANLLTKTGPAGRQGRPGAAGVPRSGAARARRGAGGAVELSSQNAEQVYEEHLRSGRAVDAIVATRPRRSATTARCAAVVKVLDANPAAVADFRAGKTAIGFLTGQVMKETRGQANAAASRSCLRNAWPSDQHRPVARRRRAARIGIGASERRSHA